jgi:hypothetical protein
MKGLKHPIRNTIFYGLFCGLSFVPLSLIFNALVSWSSAVGLTLWLFISGYAVLLNLWGNKIQISTVFPLLLLLPAIFLMDSMVLFFLLALIVISWIRSGICYQKPGAMRLAVELLLCFLGAVLVHVFTPGSMFGWALGVWMFFLVQALYFVFIEYAGNIEEETAQMDPFEQANRQAETILSNAFF